MLLEQTHNPWFWGGSDSDSDSGGRSPRSPSKNQGRSETEDELEECEGARTEGQQAQQTRTTVLVPRRSLREKEELGDASAGQTAVHGSQCGGARETRVPEEETEEQRSSSRGSRHLTVPHREGSQETNTGGPRPQQSKPSKSSKKTRHSQRVRPAPSRQPRENNTESRHPFALYGSGEKDADIAGRKTHNIGPAASTNEIHESALRAKSRREVERQIQTQRTEHRRAKSADLEKARKLIQPEFNPWITEYMHCFSARSR